MWMVDNNTMCQQPDGYQSCQGYASIKAIRGARRLCKMCCIFVERNGIPIMQKMLFIFCAEKCFAGCLQIRLLLFVDLLLLKFVFSSSTCSCN